MTPNGLLPGLGPGRGPAGFTGAGAADAAGATGGCAARSAAAAWAAACAASCAAFSSAALASAALTSTFCALAMVLTECWGPGFGLGAGGPGRAATGGRGRPGTADGLGAGRRAAAGEGDAAPSGPPPPGNDSRSRRATGASTVEDADFTNSPSSLSLAKTTLLSTPSSFASSCTRALPATGLLIRGRAATRSTSRLQLKPCHCWDFIACSYRIDLLLFRVRAVTRTTGGTERHHVFANWAGVQDAGYPQRAPEGTALFREGVTRRIRMQ
ncbi:MAG: hypothetical protein QOD41_3379 [Cryptosporangiaceae bacterium]|nr:hypothetical protein [Cryptosporangiaceae bacterium]